MRTPTERFVDTLADAFAVTGTHLSEQMCVRLEDAFIDAVEARVQQREEDARYEAW